jgi:DNA-binding transcriptional LysR family regulator
MRYTLRQLEVFLAVARAESVSHAGRELAMSQSAVSGALLDLERQFDVALFDRIGKRLQLSEFGRSVRARAESVFEEAHTLESVLANQAGPGRLRVGATLTIGDYVVVPLLARFMREEPEAQVTLGVANTEEIARRVENFEIDVGLVEGELSHPELAVTPFREDELVVFSAPSHPLARKRTLTDEDLRGSDWILRERGSGTRQTFDRAMAGLLSELSVTLELQHTEAIKAAVEAGLGLGCLSRLALRDSFRRGVLKARPVPGRDFRRRFFFVLHRRKYVTAGMRRFLALCGDAVARDRRPTE